MLIYSYMAKDLCEIKSIHQTTVRKTIARIQKIDGLDRTAEIFKLMGDMTKLKITCALSLEEMCVCDISHVLNISQSATSHQLRILRGAKLVKYRKEGRIAYYSLSDSHVKNLLSSTIKHAQHRKE
ncbi:Putative arsenical resistance operon repressor ArsR [uncultured archaeon]|nr:Putative arsenical resistance operon repressor ArsR [uncultured archaeon]